MKAKWESTEEYDSIYCLDLWRLFCEIWVVYLFFCKALLISACLYPGIGTKPLLDSNNSMTAETYGAVSPEQNVQQWPLQKRDAQGLTLDSSFKIAVVFPAQAKRTQGGILIREKLYRSGSSSCIIVKYKWKPQTWSIKGFLRYEESNGEFHRL